MKMNIRQALAITSIAALAFALVPVLDVTPAAAAAHAHRHPAPDYSSQYGDDYGPGYAATTPYGGFNNVAPACSESLGYGRYEPCDGGN
jgi:hypothetical protein